MAKGKKSTKKKLRVDPEGLVYIKASFNNIIVTVTNKAGKVDMGKQCVLVTC